MCLFSIFCSTAQLLPASRVTIDGETFQNSGSSLGPLQLWPNLGTRTIQMASEVISKPIFNLDDQGRGCTTFFLPTFLVFVTPEVRD